MIRRLISILLMIIIFSNLASCTKPEDRIKGNAQIDWVDFIKLNGKTYTGIDTAILSDPAKVEDSIGEVRFQVAETVTNPEYRTRDGDAAFWPKGTKIYALEGYADHSLVAVKDDKILNGYKLYHQEDKNAPSRWHYRDMPKDQVNKIQVYDFEDFNNQNLINNLDNRNEIQKFIALLDGSTKVDSIDLSTSTSFNVVFYSDKVYAYKYTLYFDGKDYYWSPWDTMKLPKGIYQYIQ